MTSPNPTSVDFTVENYGSIFLLRPQNDAALAMLVEAIEPDAQWDQRHFKGAMLVTKAARNRFERYDRWYQLLLEEIDLVASRNAVIVAAGNAVAQQLRQRNFPRPFTQILHHSGQAALARNAFVVGREQRFEEFSESVSPPRSGRHSGGRSTTLRSAPRAV